MHSPADRESLNGAVTQRVDALAVEQARLEAELAATKHRIAVARQRAADREQATRDALQNELTATKATIAEAERRHADEVERIRATAQAEVARILDEARSIAREARRELGSTDARGADDGD